jgi:hypothetical protein
MLDFSLVPDIKKCKAFGLKSLWKSSLCFTNLTHIPQRNWLGGNENPILEYHCVTANSLFPRIESFCCLSRSETVPGLCILLPSSQPSKIFTLWQVCSEPCALYSFMLSVLTGKSVVFSVILTYMRIYEFQIYFSTGVCFAPIHSCMTYRRCILFRIICSIMRWCSEQDPVESKLSSSDTSCHVYVVLRD